MSNLTSKLPPVIIVLLAVPVIAIALVLLARRASAMPRLPGALLLSGAVGALLTAFYVFTVSTVPIAPYESGPAAWRPVLWQLLVSVYIGFGLGVAGAAIVALPLWVYRKLHDRRRHRQGAPHAAGTGRDKPA